MTAPDPAPRKMHLSVKYHCRFQRVEESPSFRSNDASILWTREVAVFQAGIWHRYPQSRCRMIKDKVFGKKRGQWATETANYVIVTGRILAKMNC